MGTIDIPAQTLPASELARLDARFPARDVAVGGGAVVSVRWCRCANADRAR